MGDYVPVIGTSNVNYGGAGWVDGENLLTAQFNRVFSLVDSTKLDLDTWMGELKTALSSVSVPNEQLVSLQNVTIADVGGMSQLQISAPAAPSLPGFENVYFPIAPVLKPAPTLDVSYVEPTAPAEVNPTLGYVEAPYTSDMWLDLFTKVQDGVLSPTPVLSAETEEAIFARDSERKRLANEEAFAAGTKGIAMRGLPFPQLALRSLEQKTGADILRQKHDSANVIAINQAERADANAKYFIDKALDLERVTREFFGVSQRLTLDAKIAAANLILSSYAERNRAFVAQWDGIAKGLEAQGKRVELILSENQLLGEMYKIGADAAKAQSELISKERESLVDAYKADTDVYAAKVKAQSDWYNALTENQKAQLQKSALELEQAVAALKYALDAQVSTAGLKEKILEAMSNIGAQVLASALNAVNTSVGHSTSSSRGVSENFSHNQGLTDGHYTNHTPTP